MSFTGKIVLVTGAGQGIGAAIAREFAARGAHVAVNDINAAAVERTVDEIRSARSLAAGYVADVTSEEDVRAMYERIVEASGRLDVLVNNAGILSIAVTEELEVDAWERTLSVNLKGAFLCCRAVLPQMKARRSGKIINIASLAGQSGGIMPGPDYSASKGGLLALTKKIALEAAPYGVNVNAIAPGTTMTSMIEALPEGAKAALEAKIPLGRLGTPEDVAYAAVFLAGDESSFITGATLDVNGGLLMR